MPDVRRGSYADHAAEFPDAAHNGGWWPVCDMHVVRYLRPDGTLIWSWPFDARRALAIPLPPMLIRGPYRIEIRPQAATDAP